MTFFSSQKKKTNKETEENELLYIVFVTRISLRVKSFRRTIEPE